MPVHQVKKWCFTLNNPTEGEKQALADLCESEHVTYAVIGREVGDTGTPHLQGFVWFAQRKSINQAKALIGNRAHLEITHGTAQQASDYCKKDGDFDEYGSMTDGGNKESFAALTRWMESLDHRPTENEILAEFPGLFGRYHASVLRIRNLLRPSSPQSVQGDLRQWQADLEELLLADPDDRTVHFRIDESGESGKTWFTRYWLKKFPAESQYLRSGKRDDLAHAIDETKLYFFIDVPRGGMEHFQYSIVEYLKDGMIFSPKYNSTTKMTGRNVHVVVFCNEWPDMNALSADRYDTDDIS